MTCAAAILSALSKQPMTVRELQGVLAQKPRTVDRVVTRLNQRGKVRPCGTKRVRAVGKLGYLWTTT